MSYRKVFQMASPRQKLLSKELIIAFRDRLKKDGLRARVLSDKGDYEAIRIVSPSYEETFSEEQKQHILRIAKTAGMTGVRGTILNEKGTASPNQIDLYFVHRPVNPELILTAQEKPVSTISTLIASHTLEAKAKKPAVKRASGAQAPKPKMAQGKPTTSKSVGGLEIKLKALAKKFPGVTFAIKQLKTKKNCVIVRGIAKMPVNKFAELAKAIPNTSHIPQSLKGNVAIFTLFGNKQITGAAPRAPRPYFVLVSRPKGSNGKWGVEFGDYNKKDVQEELTHYKDDDKNSPANERREFKIVPLKDDKQSTMETTVNSLASEALRDHKTIRVSAPAKTSIGRLAQEKIQAPEDVIEAAITSPVIVDNQIIHKIAHAAHKSPQGFVTVGDLRKSLPLLDKTNIDAALTRMHLDQVVQLVSGSSSDVDTVNIGKEKYNRIYPMDTMMQILSDDELHEARGNLQRTKKLADSKPTPQNKSAYQKARVIFAKVLKRIQSRPAVPYAGPPKPAKTAKKVTASITQDNIQSKRQELVQLKRTSRTNPSAEIDKKIKTLKVQIESFEQGRVQPIQHETARYEEEKKKRDIEAASPAQHYALMQSAAKMRRKNEVMEELKKKVPANQHTRIEACLAHYFKMDKGPKDARRFTNPQLVDRVINDLRRGI